MSNDDEIRQIKTAVRKLASTVSALAGNQLNALKSWDDKYAEFWQNEIIQAAAIAAELGKETGEQ